MLHSNQGLVTLSYISTTYDYLSFLALCKQLIDDGKTTSHSDQELYVHYAKVNYEKMIQLDQVSFISPSDQDKIKNLSAQTWFVITEGWCGDSAHILPVLAQMVNCNHEIELKIILRDSHPEAIEHYLTNGSKSIPKLIITENGNTNLVWGPRPEPCQALYDRLRQEKVKFAEMEQQISQWYMADQGRTILSEILDKIS